MLSNSLGTAQVPTLDVSIGASDSVIALYPNTLALPTSGYAVLDSEVIYYANKSTGALQGVTRGMLGTVAAAHNANISVGSYYTQGDLSNAFMKLLVSCNGFNVRWFALKLNRFLPPGSIKGSDADITKIQIWKDNGNGTFDRDPVTGAVPPGTEILIGEKALGTSGDPAGSAVISLNDPSAGSPGFTSITSVQTTYYVTANINPSALYDDLLGLRIQSETSVIIGALTANDGIHSVSNSSMPVSTPAFLIRPTIDTMRVFVEDLAPPQASQADKHVPMLRVNMKTDANTARWDKLRVDLTSDNGAVSGDIALIKVFKDVGNDGFFGVEETSRTIDGTYINMISLGTEVFTDGVTTLTLQPQTIVSQTVNPAGQNYFVTYDMSAFAQVGVNVGLLIASTNYFTVGAPDNVAFASQTPPFSTSKASIIEAVDKVTLSVYDEAKVVSNAGGTYQAATNVPILRFTLTTDISQAYWQSLRVERTGSSNDPSFPFGHNSDVKYVKVWRDTNFNDQLDGSDELLSYPTVQFNLSDNNDRIKLIDMKNPVLISPTPRSFFLSYDIGEGAEAGASVGVKIGDRSWITVSQPNTVSDVVKGLGAGATTFAYAYETSKVSISAIQVSISGQSQSPAQIPQLSTGIPVMLFTMHTDRNHVTLQKIQFEQHGTIDTTVNGQGDVTRISVWRDDGNVIYEPNKDTMIGSVLHAATTDFVNGIANVTLNGSTGTLIDTSDVHFFVTVDVGSMSVNSVSTKGHNFYLEIPGFAGFTFTPQTAGANAANDYVGLITNNTFILDESAAIVSPVSLIPKIWMDPYGDGYPALDQGGLPMGRAFDSKAVPMVDFDGDGVNDIVEDSATRLPGIDLDGDGIIEVDMNKDGFVDVDFNNDGRPDTVIPDNNGDGVPEIDLGKDGVIDYGYIPEKWSKETSRIYAKWAPVTSSALKEYEVGVGLNNMSNGVTEAQGNNGWINTEKSNSYQLSNLTLLSSVVTKLTASVPLATNPPFNLTVQNAEDFTVRENGQITVGSEIMGYSQIVGNSFVITSRGETYGTPRHTHLIDDKVTNEAYVVRARARTMSGVVGAESAVKMYRVDVSPPSVPGTPVSDQELAGGEPATTGVFSIKWSGGADIESGVRGYEVQEREDNDPVWKTVRVVPAGQLSSIFPVYRRRRSLSKTKRCGVCEALKALATS
jgi:hypothetical protein